MTRIRPPPEALRSLRRRDPALARALDRVPPYPGFPDASRRSHFEAIARAIVYQQLAGSAAAAIFRRVRGLTPGRRFPSAGELLSMPEARLRGAGLSGAKTRALLDLSRRVHDGSLRLRSLGRLSDDDIVDRLTNVRGIGVWTAQMFLLFRLGRLDVMPATDLGVREGLRILDALPQRPSAAEVLERSEPWRPLRSVASWALWRLTDV